MWDGAAATGRFVGIVARRLSKEFYEMPTIAEITKLDWERCLKTYGPDARVTKFYEEQYKREMGMLGRGRFTANPDGPDRDVRRR